MIANLRKAGLVYVATPYSKYPGGIEAAFVEACRLTAKLVEAGVAAYSPIAHSHPIATRGRIDPYDYAIWLPLNDVIIQRCDALAVLMMDGWDTSYGVDLEVKAFRTAGKPVFFIKPEELS